MRAVTWKTNDNPKLVQAPEADPAQLQQFVERYPKLFVITGAGISRDSGIPTYRDEVGNWKTNTPIQHGDFLQLSGTRQRYWARSFGGWPNVGNARPNRAHRALARLESLGYVNTLVTQNVDRLHQKAGHKRVIDYTDDSTRWFAWIVARLLPGTRSSTGSGNKTHTWKTSG